MNESSFTGVGGLNIFTRSWLPEGEPRAAIVLVPGFNSHSEYYEKPAEQFAADGLAAYAIDLRGRGRSDGERFFVEKFDDYVSDVDGLVNMVRSEHAGLPVFILGHSAGGVVSCLYALGHQNELAGFICESFAYRLPAPDFALAVFKGLEHVFPHAHVLKLKNEDFSRDAAIVERMNNDPLIAHETQPTRTLAELVRADERLKAGFAQITLPLLILHGSADKAAKFAGSQEFYDAAGSKDKTIKIYEGGYHDLLNDTISADVMDDIRSWLNERMPAGTETAASAA